jgi:hypothetical protein
LKIYRASDVEHDAAIAYGERVSSSRRIAAKPFIAARRIGAGEVGVVFSTSRKK